MTSDSSMTGEGNNTLEEEEEEERQGDDETADEGEGENTSSQQKYPVITAVPSLRKIIHRSEGNKRDIGLLEQGCVWSLSSSKPGSGVDALRDGSFETYWQSDATQPHTATIQFQRRAVVSHVCLYLDYNLDESYTPREIALKAGMTFHDAEEFVRVNVFEPVGWIIIPCSSKLQQKPYIKAHLIQICFTAMHQNGRDTHVRLIKIFGPRNHRHVGYDMDSKFTTSIAMSQFDTIR